MGVGKTPISIYAVERGNYKVPLVICPNSLKFEWARQIEQWTGRKSAVSRSNTYTRLKEFIYPKDPDIKYRITNYETLNNDDDFEMLSLFPWDIIIFDEIHKMRNPKSDRLKKTVKSIWAFLDRFPNTKILGLSGSPIMNFPNDLYGPLATCFPERYPRNMSSMRNFFRTYMVYAAGRYGTYAYGTRNIPMLKAETQDLMIRRTKKEVLSFLPDKYYQRPELEMQPDQRKLYKQMEEELRILLDTGEPLWSPTVLSTLTRLRQINLDPKVLGVSASSAKTEYLYDLIESTDEKIVIFSCFERYVYLISQILKAGGKDVAVVTGQTPLEKRQAEVKRFQEDENCRLFMGTIQCAGEGITLTAASIVVLIDRWWNEPTNMQAVDRLHRIGQKNAVQVLLPVCSESVDAVLDEILQRKHEASQAYYGEAEVRQSVFSSII